MADPMILVVSSMFPSRALPVHAVFVQQRIQALSKSIPLQVCSPVPWFPCVHHFVGKYSHRPHISAFEDQDGLRAHFPRFLSIPRVLKPLDGWGVYRCLRAFVDRPEIRGRVMMLDAHLAFPDGWAAVRLGRELDIPVTVTLRGHDINELAHTRGRRKMVIQALQGADRIFGVAQALCDAAIEMGAPADRTFASSNGVDPHRFSPLDRQEMRSDLGLPSDARIVLSVGHLVHRKGFHHILQALAKMQENSAENLHLVIVGAGGEEGDFSGELRKLAQELGLSGRVTFAGAVANPELSRWYSAADVFCLASEKEGWPNVILEALACGIPVVATSVWGTPEIIPSPEIGQLVSWADVPALAQALTGALQRSWDPGRLRAHALEHTWDRTADGLVSHFEEIFQERGRSLPRISPGEGIAG